MGLGQGRCPSERAIAHGVAWAGPAGAFRPRAGGLRPGGSLRAVVRGRGSGAPRLLVVVGGWSA